jgi:hypothetical protein
MRLTIRRSVGALVAPLIAVSLLAAPNPAAATSGPTVQPQAGIPFNYWVDATTTLKKLNQTVTIPRGTFKGTLDLSAKTLTGSIKLPPAEAPVAIAGLPLATATFKVDEVKPVTGTFDFSTLEVTATAVFNIQLVSLTPVGLPFINLVGDSCQTSKPVRVTMSGNLAPPLKFTGKYKIPPLENCGAATTALNLAVPGPGNVFSAVATPK